MERKEVEKAIKEIDSLFKRIFEIRDNLKKEEIEQIIWVYFNFGGTPVGLPFDEILEHSHVNAMWETIQDFTTAPADESTPWTFKTHAEAAYRS